MTALARIPLLVAGAFVAAFVLAPLGLMLADTLQGKDGWTASAWSQLLATETDRVQLLRTAWLGLAATAVATLLGASYAWVTVGTDLRHDFDQERERPRESVVLPHPDPIDAGGLHGPERGGVAVVEREWNCDRRENDGKRQVRAGQERKSRLAALAQPQEKQHVEDRER